jgi:hypothetical protein
MSVKVTESAKSGDLSMASTSAVMERLRGVAFEGRNWGRTQLRADLRALLDAHAEALDALARIENPDNYGPDGGWNAKGYPDEIARAVLAKAGRR